MRVSVSVQRISTSTMKVLAIISLAFACVAARGSGPYLPRGWKPDGPSFYLPSEVLKPSSEPVKEVIFSESEPSGSDFLREYGPPKVQEISEGISKQALPDLVNEQLFIKTVVENTESKQNSNIFVEASEQNVEVTAEVKAAQEPIAITESQSVAKIESVTKAEVKYIQVNDETTTLPTAESVNAVDEFGYLVQPTVAIEVQTEKVAIENHEHAESVNAVDDFGYLVQPTVAIEVPTEKVTIENLEHGNLEHAESLNAVDQFGYLVQPTLGIEVPTEKVTIENLEHGNREHAESLNAVDQFGYLVQQAVAVEVQTEKVTNENHEQSQKQFLGDVVSEILQLANQEQKSDQSVQFEETGVTDFIQLAKEDEQLSSDTTVKTEPSYNDQSGTVVTQQDTFDVISVVQEKLKTEEDVTNVEKIVENIPEIIVNLENDIKSQQSATIQKPVPLAIQEIFGTLDQPPEGFLEYGPPGFTEYGPPKEDLRGNTIEENNPDTSEVRRRRFSPKFRLPRKSH